ncbi:hypothetical protein L3Q82_008997 [Scortum barcoo]|uniref:Uncharacterized protein n=1 Tax=Scortum barcoo TaxID=214431 RepID=A0ACB8XC02_9TELE|nr:hypothetical protein L3Q82_008997 [Scortum barcoo]
MDPEVPHSPDGETSKPGHTPKNQRSLRSLNVLTTRFVKLLQEAEGGVLDLKDTVWTFVKQKLSLDEAQEAVVDKCFLCVLSGRQDPGCRTEKANLRHHECAGGRWSDCENLKKHYKVEDFLSLFSPGHTLLAVRAPSGTQLDVPIPKVVLNSPVRYQIHLKSINGPIDVVLLNKKSISSVPVVLPVPPSEEILRDAKSAMSASDETESSVAPCQASADTKHRARSCELQDLSKELKDLLHPTKGRYEITSADLITELMASEVFSPLLRLSPPPSEYEYVYNLDESEGLCDLFDIPVLNV